MAGSSLEFVSVLLELLFHSFFYLFSVNVYIYIFKTIDDVGCLLPFVPDNGCLISGWSASWFLWTGNPPIQVALGQKYIDLVQEMNLVSGLECAWTRGE